MKLTPGQPVYFVGEKLPFNVMAASYRYAVCSRKLNRRQDAALLHFEVERGASNSFTEAYNASKDSPVYSIIDFGQNIRGTHNLIFNVYDFFHVKSCERCLRDIENKKIEVSHRNRTTLDIDLKKTKTV